MSIKPGHKPVKTLAEYLGNICGNLLFEINV